MRFEAAIDPMVSRSYEAMFPGSRRQQLDARALSDEALARIKQPYFLIHGRDDRIAPLDTSLPLLEKLPDVQSRVYGQSGRWMQIEYADSFHNLLNQLFLE